jgi:hypothetical protein
LNSIILSYTFFGLGALGMSNVVGIIPKFTSLSSEFAGFTAELCELLGPPSLGFQAELCHRGFFLDCGLKRRGQSVAFLV